MTAADQNLVIRVLDSLTEMGPIDTRPYFGGTAFVADGHQFVFAMGNELYLAVDDRTRPEVEAFGATAKSENGQPVRRVHQMTVDTSSPFIGDGRQGHNMIPVRTGADDSCNREVFCGPDEPRRLRAPDTVRIRRFRRLVPSNPMPVGRSGRVPTTTTRA